MARKITIEFLGKDSTSKTTRAVEQRFGKLGGTLDRVGQRAGKVLGAGLLVAGTAAVKLGQQASDLAETQSKVAQVFGEESAVALDKFAAKAATAMGMSKQAALDGAATFGIIGKSAGLSGEELTGFSTKMVGLAGDMASFNNTSPEEATLAIGAAMRGEAEPIRRFGVLLDDATLRNRALKMGLIKTTKDALKPQTKALAAQAEILAQTSDQQGDFARTSDGLANKQRILKANLENMGTALGQKVLPALLKLTDAGMKALEWMEDHQKLVGTVVVVLGSLAAGLYAVSVAMRVMNLVMSANPVVLFVGALVALGVGLVVAYKKVDWFRAGVDTAFKAIGKVATWLWNSAIQPMLKLLVTGFALMLKTWGVMLTTLGKVPGFGWAKSAGEKMKKAGDKALGLRDSINKIPNGKKITVRTPGMGTAISQARTLLKLLSGKGTGGVGVQSKTPGQFDPDAYASGTNFATGGVSLVGEKGPELVSLRRGAQVVPNNKLGMSSGGGDVYNFYVSGALDAESTAKQIEQILAKRRKSVGRPLAFT